MTRPDIQIRRLKTDLAAIKQQHKMLREKYTRLAHQLSFSLGETNEKEAQAKRLYEALEALYSNQNGPPLERKKHKDSWNRAMKLSISALKEIKL